jgi:hypothetical protein
MSSEIRRSCPSATTGDTPPTSPAEGPVAEVPASPPRAPVGEAIPADHNEDSGVFDPSRYVAEIPWSEYASDETGSVYFFNPLSVNRHIDSTEVLVQIDNSRDRTVKARYGENLIEIYCSAHVMRELRSTKFDKKGRVLSSFNFPSNPIQIRPNTVGRDLWDKVCVAPF